MKIINVIGLNRFIAANIIIFSFAGCMSSSEFYDMGKGFKFGYFDTKKTSNVYYDDQGVIHGICYSVEWNEKYILMRYYPYDSNGNLLTYTKISLIEKNLYIKKPVQLESDAIISTCEDSVDYWLHKSNISFTNRKDIPFNLKE